jgi:hypothetical protein
MRGFLGFALVAAVMASATGPAMALSVSDCDGFAASAQALVEPWEQNTRTFYKGQVRIAYIDTVEPACCSSQLLVLIPNKNSEMGERLCQLVSDHGNQGFAGIDFAKITTSYDANKGLLVSFPYGQMKEDGSGTVQRMGRIRINLATVTVRPE